MILYERMLNLGSCNFKPFGFSGIKRKIFEIPTFGCLFAYFTPGQIHRGLMNVMSADVH